MAKDLCKFCGKDELVVSETSELARIMGNEGTAHVWCRGCGGKGPKVPAVYGELRITMANALKAYRGK